MNFGRSNFFGIAAYTDNPGDGQSNRTDWDRNSRIHNPFRRNDPNWLLLFKPGYYLHIFHKATSSITFGSLFSANRASFVMYM